MLRPIFQGQYPAFDRTESSGYAAAVFPIRSINGNLPQRSSQMKVNDR
jgi:hypothetical protein